MNLLCNVGDHRQQHTLTTLALVFTLRKHDKVGMKSHIEDFLKFLSYGM